MTTNFGVVEASSPVGNSYVGNCVSNALTHSDFKFGPPVTVFALCLYDAGSVTAQAASAGVATVQAASVSIAGGAQDQPPQGEPSEEALILLESLRQDAAEREALVNSTK